MPIAFIYQPEDRNLVEPYHHNLRMRGFDIRMGPLGLTVGTVEWFERIKLDIQHSNSALLFYTLNFTIDDTMEQRLQIVAERIRKDKSFRLLPLALNKGSFKFTCKLSNDVPFLSLFQTMDIGGYWTIEDACDYLAHTLPKDPPKLFVSYSRDDHELVDKVVDQMVKTGLDVWQDKRNIGAGMLWDNQIEESLRKSTFVIYFHSINSRASRNVSDELSFALELGKPIIPVLLDDSKLPYRVHRAQGILTADSDPEALARQIGDRTAGIGKD